MLNLQFAETMELTEAELEIVYGGEFGNNAVIPAGAWGGFGHLGQSLISGRKILTIDLTLILTAVVINIQSPCLFLGRGCLYFIV
ncbi:Uncharacterised protein [Streptococcus pneumoniae]|nr:Uncharacterised protein [Streptococcus pneumoniae]CAG5384955.1 Uncharacterised protein [Streptococcus pneumoniae]